MSGPHGAKTAADSGRHAELLAACGIDDQGSWNDYAARVRQTWRGAGQPLTRWSPAHLLTALDLAVRGRGWPPEQAATALQQVASDPATRSPARLAEAGRWWDRADPVDTQAPADIDMAALEVKLDAVDGRRLDLQQRARQQLAAEGLPVTRPHVIRRAVALLGTEA